MLTIPDLRSRRLRPLTYPYCGETLTPVPLVVASRGCPGCGRRVIAEPEPTFDPPFTREQLDAASDAERRLERQDEPAGPLPSVTEFKTSIARITRAANRAVWIVYGLLPALPAACIGLFAAVGFDPHRFWLDLENRHGPMATAAVQAGVAVLWTGTIGGLFAAGLYAIGRRRRKLREGDATLACPHCRSALMPAPIVIAARQCPACRRIVLADPDGLAAGVSSK